MTRPPSDARLAALHDVALALSSELDRRRLYEGIVHGARRLLGVPFAAVASWDEGREELVIEASAGAPETLLVSAPPGELPVGAGRAFRERQTVLLDDLAAERRATATERGLGLRAFLAAPLPRDDAPAGVVLAAYTAPGPRFDAEDARLLSLLAGHASLALAKAEAAAEAARRLAGAEELTHALRGILEARRTEVIFDRALDCATTILAADRAAIFLLDRDERVTEAAGRRLSRAYLETISASYRRSAGGQVTATRTPVFIADLVNDPRTRAVHDLILREGVRSLLLLPLLYREELIGVLGLYHELVWRYGVEDMAPARALADQLALALGNAALHERTERQLAQLRVLEALVRAVSDPVPAEERCRRGAAAIVGRASATSAWIYQQDDRGAMIVAARAGASALSDPDAAAAAAIQAGAPVSHQVPGAEPLVAAPILHEGRALGALVVAAPHPPTFEPRAATTHLHLGDRESPEVRYEFVATAAGQLAVALVNARLLEESVKLGALWSAVLEGLPDAVMVYGPDDRIIYFNRVVQEIYGLGERDLRGWTRDDFVREVSRCFADPAVPIEISRRVSEGKGADVDRVEFELVAPARRRIERVSAPLFAGGVRIGRVVVYHQLGARS
jgi:GAF domain-containing protein